MSRIEVKQPIVHTPSFKEYKIAGSELKKKYEGLGIKVWPMSYYWYYHTDAEGWAKLLLHLVIKSNLYVADRRTCAWYAKKATVLCNELYKLNTLPETWGGSPLGYHAFNTFWTGDSIMILEPNEGFDDGDNYQDIWGALDDDIVFALGDNGYKPDNVFL